jgi:acyl-CoA thioester hydrolase
MLFTVSTIAVRYAETDQMGVVHHSNYPVYFEAGRTDFFHQHLVHYTEMEKLGLFAPVISYGVEIKGRATYGDVLELETRPAGLKGLRLSMAYRITGKAGLIASGSSTHALVTANLKPAHPRVFGELYDRLKRAFA